jgi:Ca2+:H+ antiporter
LTRAERLLLGLVALLTVAAGVARYAGGFSHVAAFVLATIALAGAAWVVSFATEQVGERFGPAVTGVMQATIGNLPEFFVVLFALGAGQLVVAQTAIVGSILVNALLVLGLVIVVGARRGGGIMRFNPRLPNDTATLLMGATFIIVLIGLVDAAHDPASHHTKTISIVGAAAILVVYALWLAQYLRGGESGGSAELTARVAVPAALLLLAVAGTASAFVSDWFVHSLKPTIHTLHISKQFAGLVIVAIASNAVEHGVGIALAARGRSELAISVVKNSVSQLAAFLYPLLVLVSLATATTLTFALPPLYIGALFGTALIVWQVTGDGEATVFEGSALVAAFVILATVAAYQ